jgi:triphosphoribosyl-dephospho-CoA synthase
MRSATASPLPAPEERIAAAFVAACEDELAALKPGNVHRYADGHGMRAADFSASAAAAAPALTRGGRRVGRRILDATAATWAAVGCNTNLGIVLLCAPMAYAAETVLASGAAGVDGDRLAAGIGLALAELDIDDAERAFRAIALANPGGLGENEAADVRAPARIDLRRAMQLAAAHDRIAMQYVNGFSDIMDFALPCFRQLLAAGDSRECATTGVYLAMLARWPDTHLLRKFSDSVAQTVTREAQGFHDKFMRTKLSPQLRDELLAWDSRLKTQGLNPGTSADMTVATLFAHRLGEV